MNTLPLAAKDNSKLEDFHKCLNNCSVKYPSHWTSQSLTNQYINCLDGCDEQHPRGYELQKQQSKALATTATTTPNTGIHLLNRREYADSGSPIHRHTFEFVNGALKADGVLQGV